MSTAGRTVRDVCEEAAGYGLDPIAYAIWGVTPDELYDQAAARLAAKEPLPPPTAEQLRALLEKT